MAATSKKYTKKAHADVSLLQPTPSQDQRLAKGPKSVLACVKNHAALVCRHHYSFTSVATQQCCDLPKAAHVIARCIHGCPGLSGGAETQSALPPHGY